MQQTQLKLFLVGAALAATVTFVGAALATTLVVGSVAHADAYSDARADLVAAYQAEDYAAMRVAAAVSLEARPEFPGALFNLAFAESLDGDVDAAMATLGRLVEKRIDFGVENIEAFAPLREHPVWDSYLANTISSRKALLSTAPVASSSAASALAS